MIKNTILKKFAIPLVCLTMLVGLCVPALAATTINKQIEIEDDATATNPQSNINDTVATAQSISYTLNTSSVLSFMQGTIKDIKDVDYYKFVYRNSAGSNGRFAIKLEVGKYSNDYDLMLVDANNKTILTGQNYTQAGFRQNKIIRVPANTLINNNTYYIKIVPKTIGSPTATGYSLQFVDNIATAKMTPPLGIVSLDSYNGKMSTPGLINLNRETLDPNAKVLSVTFTATKGAIAATNWQLYVTSGAKYPQKWYNAIWNTGDVPELKTAGLLLKDNWYIAFSGTSLMSGINVVNVRNPILTINYEYDTTFGL